MAFVVDYFVEFSVEERIGKGYGFLGFGVGDWLMISFRLSGRFVCLLLSNWLIPMANGAMRFCVLTISNSVCHL